MKKGQVLSIVIIGLASLLSFIYSLINLIESGSSTVWVSIGSLLYTILVAIALVYAIFENRCLEGLIIVSFKSIFPQTNLFFTEVLPGTVKYDSLDGVFSILFTLLAVGAIVAIILQLYEFESFRTKITLKNFAGPLIVLVYLLVFSSYSNAIISSMTEVFAILLLADLTAEFLFLSVFIAGPFNFIQLVANGNELKFFDYLYVIVSILLFGYGVYALINHWRHSKHEDLKECQD